MATSPAATDEQAASLNPPSRYFVLECTTVSMLALVLFDWAITFAREVDLFWTGKARPLSAVLFFANRYLNILPYVVTAVQMASISDKSCVGTVIAFRVFLYFSYLPPAAFTALRAYALTRWRWLSIMVFVLLTVPFVTNMVALMLHGVVGLRSPTWGCIGGGSGSDFWSTLLSEKYAFIMNRAFAILADTTLVIVTWMFLPVPAATGSMDPAGARIKGKPQALASIMLYNGMTYFLMMSALNILQLVLVTLHGLSLVADGLTLLYLTPPLSSVLVSHFLLDLQEAHQRTVAGVVGIDGPLDTSRILHSSINLADALGSIGAIVDPAADYVLEEADSEPEGMEGFVQKEGQVIHDF